MSQLYGGAKTKKKGKKKEKENPPSQSVECVETEHEGLPFLNFQNKTYTFLPLFWTQKYFVFSFIVFMPTGFKFTNKL